MKAGLSHGLPLIVALVVGSPGCRVDPYRLAGDAGAADGGPVVVDGQAADGAPDACVPLPEVCDGRDNDCNGITDDGFDLANDPVNCGECGLVCDRPNTWGSCVEGTCRFECQPGYHDLDGDPDNGCEYACIPTYGGQEACDGFDNDCDGQTDEDFDLLNDPENCSECGRRCEGINSTAACVAGACEYTCDPGFGDVLPAVPGCEYPCPVYPPEPETCNFVDDDCDGDVDEGNPEGGATCGTDEGECVAGVTTCLVGVVVCQGAVGPTVDLCDDLDNDCDGLTDEDYDKLNDPGRCGSCQPCSLPNALAGCSGGICVIAVCDSGYVDADGDPANGCEYPCTPSGPEVCDGLDNDCDTLTDTNDPDLYVPSNFCRTEGPCAGTVPVCGTTACDSTVQWRCIYSAPAETDACGTLALQETLCDDVDGNCDGLTDETFPLKGAACDDGGIGACMGTGAYVCDATGTGVDCDITDPGATPTAETCNGIDDDCDGTPDNGAPDTMVNIVTGPMDFWIDVYEASRPDATATDTGILGHRSCSNPDVLPWRNVSWTEAEAACAAAGKRLCTEAEWQEACQGPSAYAYPYGDTYLPEACNGKDYDPDCADPDDDFMLATGTPFGCPPPADTLCISDWSVIDMSGNLMEWTGTTVSASPLAYRVRGGAYNNIETALTCQFDFISAEPDFRYGDLGFRCCSDVRPW